MDNFDKLRTLANAAASGPWTVQTERIGGDYFVSDSAYQRVCERASGSDAAYIAAANPARVLALLDELERKTAALKVVRNSLSMLPKLNGPANVTLTRIAMTVGNALQDCPE